MESPIAEIGRVADELPEDSEIKDIFYPMMCFFQNVNAREYERDEIAANSAFKEFDMAVLEILISFN
jgi:hypothetical protein